MKETFKGILMANPYNENFRIGLQNILEEKDYYSTFLLKKRDEFLALLIVQTNERILLSLTF